MNHNEYPENKNPARPGRTLVALSIAGLVDSVFLKSACAIFSAGPNGGDVVALGEGSSNAAS